MNEQQRKAMELALEAYLCREMPAGTIIGDPKWWVPKIANAIKKALAQPEQQEPVAWAMLHDNGDFIDAINLEEHARVEGQYKHPLYTTPPQRKPLTHEEIMNIFYKNRTEPLFYTKCTRDIEQAHGIKENT